MRARIHWVPPVYSDGSVRSLILFLLHVNTENGVRLWEFFSFCVELTSAMNYFWYFVTVLHHTYWNLNSSVASNLIDCDLKKICEKASVPTATEAVGKMRNCGNTVLGSYRRSEFPKIDSFRSRQPGAPGAWPRASLPAAENGQVATETSVLYDRWMHSNAVKARQCYRNTGYRLSHLSILVR